MVKRTLLPVMHFANASWSPYDCDDCTETTADGRDECGDDSERITLFSKNGVSATARVHDVRRLIARNASAMSATGPGTVSLRKNRARPL